MKPWNYYLTGPAVHYIIKGEHEIAMTCGQKTQSADARLIAAAPELYESLRLMVSAGEFHYRDSGWPSQFHAGALTAARAALAKVDQ